MEFKGVELAVGQIWKFERNQVLYEIVKIQDNTFSLQVHGKDRPAFEYVKEWWMEDYENWCLHKLLPVESEVEPEVIVI